MDTYIRSETDGIYLTLLARVRIITFFSCFARHLFVDKISICNYSHS